MKNFKLKKGISTVYPITNEKDFYDLTGGRRPYMETGKDGKKRAFGICPGCDNPIQIVGLYYPVKNTDKPYYSIHLVIIVYSYLFFCYTPFKKQFWRIRNATLSCYTY